MKIHEIPDSDRVKRPLLWEPSATDQELNPGDREQRHINIR